MRPRVIARLSASAVHGLASIMLAAALAAAPVAAMAQDVGQQDVGKQSVGQAADAAALPSDAAAATATPEIVPLSEQESAALANALVFGPALSTGAKPAKPLRLPGLSDPHGLDVSRTDKPDGSSTVVVKQPLASEWGAHVGADLGPDPAEPPAYRPDKPLPVIRDGRGSGSAWATVGLPNLATLDARVDPGNDQGKLGATFKRSIPLGGRFSVTLQNSYSVTETFGQPPPAPADLPLAVAPPTTPATPVPQVWSNEKAAKFAILSTGTTLAAGLASSSTDPVTHNTLSAEQKLYGPLQVTTAITDVGQPTVSKSITAGFKLHW